MLDPVRARRRYALRAGSINWLIYAGLIGLLSQSLVWGGILGLVALGYYFTGVSIWISVTDENAEGGGYWLVFTAHSLLTLPVGAAILLATHIWDSNKQQSIAS